MTIVDQHYLDGGGIKLESNGLVWIQNHCVPNKPNTIPLCTFYHVFSRTTKINIVQRYLYVCIKYKTFV